MIMSLDDIAEGMGRLGVLPGSHRQLDRDELEELDKDFDDEVRSFTSPVAI
jgi:hypothetical protein